MRATGTKSVAGDLLHTAASPNKGENPPNFAAAMLADTVLKRVAEVQVGEYTGTGAALDVPLDFDPIFVFLVNLTDGDEWAVAFNTATVGTKSTKVVGAAGPATIAAQGILFAAAGARKFSLGTDADINQVGKVYQFVAIGA